MSSHQLQQNRFELKYLIHERCARGVRDFARSYLVADEHADPNNNYSYAIHSIYLDGPGMELYNSTVQGHKNRYKLRIRYYDDRPENPVFFEIKRRVNDAILKQRAMVKRYSVPHLLGSFLPGRSDLVNEDDDRSWESLNHFCNLAEQLQALGRIIVSYVREAWVTEHDNSVRITFDRNLVATRFTGGLVVADLHGGIRPHIPGVILEIKFTDRFPVWIREMVRTFNLQRGPMAKYVHCIDAMQRREVDSGFSRLGAMI